MNKKIVKEAIIIILLLIVIIFAMGILFYDSITENADVIASAEYEISDAVKEVLDDIEESGGEDLNETTSSSLLKSYSINAEDLSNYASGNYYESGKKDPFAESAEIIDEHTTTTVKTGTATQSQTSNPIADNEKDTTVKITNTVVTNTVKNTTNTIKNITTNTVKNTVTSNKVNTVKNTAKDKTESTSTTGIFFENKNSK